ncbi:MAG: DNA polymerase III subunit delta [Clostridia bacterium]|nr:DNA polymerase III subunit delta [Clostridia bacterium]
MKREGAAPEQVLAAARAGRHRGRVFLFYGPERHLLQLTLERLTACLPAQTRAFNYRKAEGSPANPAADLLAWAYSPPVGADWRLLVVRDEELFTTGKGKRQDDVKAYLAYLAQPAPACCLVLVAGTEVEEGNRLYQALGEAGGLVYFGSPSTAALRRWAQEEAATHGKKLAADALAYLVTASGGDLGFLRGAVTKACLFSTGREVTLAAAQAVVTASPQGSIFHLVDAVGERDAARALLFLRRRLLAGEPPLQVAFMLGRQVRLILQAKLLLARGRKAEEIARTLALPSFVVEKLLAQGRGFTAERLKEALGYLALVDARLKSGRDAQAVLEESVLYLCRPASRLAGPHH